MVQEMSCVFLRFVQNWDYINRYKHWNNNIQKIITHSDTQFTLHIWPCPVPAVIGCSTAIDISSHRGKVKMCIHIIRNVIFFDLEYLQDIRSTEPIPGQGPLKPIKSGLSRKVRKNGIRKCYREIIAVKNQEVTAWTWLLASIECQV
jgi:hypothetical protein